MNRILNTNGGRGLVAILVLALGGLTAPGLAPDVRAGSTERIGTNSAPELSINVGPRANALGGNGVADVKGSESIYWNPAGLAVLNGTEASFTHVSHIGETNVNYFSIATRAGSIGNLGFSAKVFSAGDVIVTTETAPDGTGEILSPTFATIGVTYARQFTDRVRFGANMMFVNESIAEAHAKGIAFDFGFQYDTNEHGLVFGFSMKNFGPALEYEGASFDVNTPPPGSEPGSSNRTLRFTTTENELPSYFQIGGAYNLWQQGTDHRVQVLGTFTSNNFTPDDFRVGAEYKYRENLALRAGYNSFVSDTDLDTYDGISFGAGVGVPLGTARLQFDYAQRMVNDWFGDTHEFGVRVLF
ncbi:MAG: PorV/PorQ family protein [Candidatus Eiseniibacteriota bacterium]